MIEQAIVNEILLMLGRLYPHDVRAWRNNTGALKDGNGRVVKFGCPGSPDIIGIAKPGRFIGIEVKTLTGRQSEQQRMFQKMVESMGGKYFLVRSVEEAEAQITGFLVDLMYA